MLKQIKYKDITGEFIKEFIAEKFLPKDEEFFSFFFNEETHKIEIIHELPFRFVVSYTGKNYSCSKITVRLKDSTLRNIIDDIKSIENSNENYLLQIYFSNMKQYGRLTKNQVVGYVDEFLDKIHRYYGINLNDMRIKYISEYYPTEEELIASLGLKE